MVTLFVWRRFGKGNRDGGWSGTLSAGKWNEGRPRLFAGPGRSVGREEDVGLFGAPLVIQRVSKSN
jgi:hypothetical protein